MKSTKPLLIRDPIHGDMVFNDTIREIVDHSLFQRLRGIHQNSLLYLIFPSARHSRFEHSLGACYLAGSWYNSIFDKLETDKLDVLKTKKESTRTDNTEVLLQDTYELYQEIKGNSKERWQNIITIAALLHDVGHGPFSHLIEDSGVLGPHDLWTSVEKIKGQITDSNLMKYLEITYKDKSTKNCKVKHEDISLIFTNLIFNDLEKQNQESNSFFSKAENLLPVLCLISKDFKDYVLSSGTLPSTDKNTTILFSPIVSGFIDIDRLDYIKRDCYFAGVSYGLIETKRLIYALTPVLVRKDTKLHSTLIGKFNDAHMVDHFLIGLYEVYTQLIFHPKNVQYGHELCTLLQRLQTNDQLKDVFSEIKNNLLEWYKDTADHDFTQKLKIVKNSSNEIIIDKIFERKYRASVKQVIPFPPHNELPENIKATHKLIEVVARNIVKDGTDLWLYSNVNSHFFVFDWNSNSLVATKLKHQKFKPLIWWNNEKFENDLNNIKVEVIKLVTSDEKIAVNS